jgi:hypothetical protein
VSAAADRNAVPVGRQILDVRIAQLPGDGIHHVMLAIAALEGVQLRFEVDDFLPGEIRNIVADSHAIRAVAGLAWSARIHPFGDVARGPSRTRD